VDDSFLEDTDFHVLIDYSGEVIPYINTRCFYKRVGKFVFYRRCSKLVGSSSRVVVDLVVGSIKGEEWLW
jgi:hypothetical protein